MNPEQFIEKNVQAELVKLGFSSSASNSTQMTMIKWKDWRKEPIVINNLV
ncbi:MULTISPECIES: hypothetical protein [Photorhabdus]|nr:hypothetical protein [Photorhabdus luminescens]